MLPQSAGPSLAFFLAATLAISPISASQAEPTTASVSCEKLLEAPASGQSAVDQLGERIAVVAEINRRTVAEMRTLLNNKSFHLDTCGRGFFAETVILPQQSPLPNGPTALGSSLPTGTSSDPIILAVNKADTFKLHSSPESKQVIYLDFNGERIEGTQWNLNFNGGKAWDAVGFSQDGDFANYSDTEIAIIQSVWQRVAEDFAPFDIDVTTEFPGDDRITKTDDKDENFGTRVLISNDTIIFKACKCSGLAYLGSFDLIGKSHKENQPAWVFTQGVGDNPKYIAESITHEVGHTLGLSHDGAKESSYYGGLDGWAPIMGVGFYQPITQWSKGEYQGADNDEDDYEIMSRHGLKLRPDEDSNTIDTARKAEEKVAFSGIIQTPMDIDYFKFIPPVGDNYVIKVEPASMSPNLDLTLTLYPRSNPVDKTINNPANIFVTTDSAQGLSATISKKLNGGTEYIIEVDGGAIKSGDSKATDYGSLGIYKLTIIRGKASDTNITATSNSNINAASSLANKLILPVGTTTIGGAQKGFLPVELGEELPTARYRGQAYAI